MSVHDNTIDPEIEARRMAAVRRYDILDTPPDGAFDRIAAMAARRFGVPFALVSIVDSDRIWFKSRHGLEGVEEVGRDPGLCSSAILTTAPHVVPDARLDPGALANPLVAGSFGLRFYAGVPLTTGDGFNLGVLCVIDREPRIASRAQLDDLKDLACVVIDQMELRVSARRAVAQAELMAREIDHRVMNSLQLVASMLAMQGRSSASGDAARALEIAAGRVGAVARVHRHFHTADGDSVSCVAFLRRFCSDLAGVLARPVEFYGDETDVPARMIQPIGLIANELITNAAKYGQGRIAVSLRVVAGLCELRVSDEGEGVPAGFDPSVSAGLGMKIVGVLADGLGGRLSWSPDPRGEGAWFAVSLSGNRKRGPDP